MRNSPVALSGAACVFLLIGAADAPAEMIQWSYSWSRSPVEVHADSPGSGYISLTDGGLHSAAGDSNLVATNLQTHSTAPTNAPDVFTNRPYTLKLYLQDKDSGTSGTLSFAGEFNGALTAESANIKNTFVGPTTQTLVLGDHLYKVTIDSYSAPGPTGAQNSGSIAAHAEITVSTIFHAPEPGSGILALLGSAGLGFIHSRRRVRG